MLLGIGSGGSWFALFVVTHLLLFHLRPRPNRFRVICRVYLAALSPDGAVTPPLAPGRHAWLQVVRGRVTTGEQPLQAGDGLAVSDESALAVRADGAAEVLLFDLA